MSCPVGQWRKTEGLEAFSVIVLLDLAVLTKLLVRNSFQS